MPHTSPLKSKGGSEQPNGKSPSADHLDAAGATPPELVEAVAAAWAALPEADRARAGVFTTNAFCAAPVQLARRHLAAAAPRYLLINTGNANAGTGAPGMTATELSCETLASLSGVQPAQVLPFSTGVIGELLPVARVQAGLPAALAALAWWRHVRRGGLR